MRCGAECHTHTHTHTSGWTVTGFLDSINVPMVGLLVALLATIQADQSINPEARPATLMAVVAVLAVVVVWPAGQAVNALTDSNHCSLSSSSSLCLSVTGGTHTHTRTHSQFGRVTRPSRSFQRRGGASHAGERETERYCGASHCCHTHSLTQQVITNTLTDSHTQ